MGDASFASRLDAILGSHADSLAFSGAVDWTYAALRSQIEAWARRLDAWGVVSGDIVATSLPSDAHHAALLYALLSREATACPLDPTLPHDAMRARLERVGASLLISPDGGAALSGAQPCQQGSGVLVFTSGSSTEPKAAFLRAKSLCASARLSDANIPVQPEDRWLLSLPLYHVSGLGVLFRCLLAGAAVQVPVATAPLEETLRTAPVTHVSFVPMQLRRLLDTASGLEALVRIKAVLLGGAPVPSSLVREAAAHGVRLYTSYGLTEMASQVTTTRPGEPLEGLLTSGRPLAPGTLSFAPDGEIRVKGEQLFAGYWTAGAIDLPVSQDGWFATRDLGFLDSRGYLVVTGRKDNMFVCGGENIQPEEIERHLMDMDGVISAIVVPVEDPLFGQAPVAYVRTRDDRPPDGGVLLAGLRQILPRHKVPKLLLPWPEEEHAMRGLKVARAWLKRRAEEDFRRAAGTP